MCGELDPWLMSASIDVCAEGWSEEEDKVIGVRCEVRICDFTTKCNSWRIAQIAFRIRPINDSTNQINQLVGLRPTRKISLNRTESVAVTKFIDHARQCLYFVIEWSSSTEPISPFGRALHFATRKTDYKETHAEFSIALIAEH